MNALMIARLTDRYATWPEGVGGPVAEPDIKDAESRLQIKFPDDYRRFLLTFGSGIVGSLPVFGLNEPPYGVDHLVTDASERYRGELPAGFEKFVAVSVDLGGNPIGFLPESPTIICFDHDFGGGRDVASSFTEFLEQLLK